MTSTYRRVSSGNDAAADAAETAVGRRTSSSRSSNSNSSSNFSLADKLTAAAWMTVAVATARWTHFYSVVLSASASAVAANRPLLRAAVCLLGVNTVLVAYLTLYLPAVKGLTDSSAWAVYCPRVIPCMTLTGIAAALLLIRGLWPVWGFLAPAILGTQAMGWLFAAHFVPWPFS
jgi:hypothetical protein